MTRPTAEDLHVALAEIRGTREHAVIEAELRALREERDAWQAGSGAQADAVAEMRATLARVQELPGKWRDIVRRVLVKPYVQEAVVECAKDLEEALRGPER